MHIKKAIFMLVAAFLILSLFIFNFTKTDASARVVYAYATHDYSGDNSSYNSFVNNESHINYVITFTYGIDENGNLNGEEDDAVKDEAIKNNIAPLLLVHNIRGGTFDNSLIHSVLSNKAARNNLIDNIENAVINGDYKGVNIDFENVGYVDRQNYNQFLSDLKSKLDRDNLLLTVAIPALTADSPNSLWAGGFDYAAISKIADKIIIMAYDQHWSGGNSGPICSIDWLQNVTKYALSTIDKDKIVMGLPAYGYDWSLSGTTSVTEDEVRSLINTYGGNAMWDNTSKEPYYIYYKNGVKHTVWFENSYSFKLKLDYLSSIGIDDISFWKLGYENQDFWEVIEGNTVDYFGDIFASWARDDINEMARLKYVSGYSDDTYRPNNYITRAEFITLLLRVKGIKEEPGEGFWDTQQSFAKDAIATAKKLGIVNGYSDGSFRPNNNISREEIAAIIAKAYGYEPYADSLFVDIGNSFAKNDIIALSNRGIISGYDTYHFMPKNYATRAEATAILYRLINK
ncbi:S-layer homology domain-containing protein [Thermoanaerobacterium thermosaccharolyticum]|uniref:Putative glycosyl hydrolase n=1 Tax=Thermoanaerobacterium thermosaccharolyticum M0795 TaxID=698948 RepID=L0IL33_THETR|nr:S-layer homology domain-containing protein [Thermoanaerobacterium thermosaccharolyticum]AGB18687.1 putative glycosyl hydrolase [Thermoanaerobacterium thermosaccharolyticum M0795]